WVVWPALLVAGGSFAGFQFTFATVHAYVPSIVLYPMTDIGGGIFSLILTAIFLRFWRPRQIWHFDKKADAAPLSASSASQDAGAAKPAAILPSESAAATAIAEAPLTAWNVSLA